MRVWCMGVWRGPWLGCTAVYSLVNDKGLESTSFPPSASDEAFGTKHGPLVSAHYTTAQDAGRGSRCLQIHPKNSFFLRGLRRNVDENRGESPRLPPPSFPKGK
ncbi:unnamed protein product [Pylaiella littoralis]